MTNAHVNIGTVPYEEDCAQTGITPDALGLNRLECRAYIAALRSKFGCEPEGSRLRVRSHPHDFGMYAEVVFEYDADSAACEAYAELVEEGVARWADADMWAPVLYDGATPISVIRDEALWARATNPLGYASASEAALHRSI